MEMFIVSSGAVQVVGGPGDSIVFVTLGQVHSKIFTLVHYKIFKLGQGVCFGEIALLGTGGMNRRTASINPRGGVLHARTLYTSRHRHRTPMLVIPDMEQDRRKSTIRE